jgi:putative endonuclease
VIYVYFLQSKKHKKYIYVGLTNNIKRRLIEHNHKESELATAPYRPLDLAGYVAVNEVSKARKLEKYFKVGSGKAFLKKRILPDEAPREFQRTA